ncbi:putative sugar O-methyltransferase [Actinomadura macra]|uniref:putative sugar O-methyltransferase n=1 Tax=Actinomadura macra TaxID=46164 RepID=UPI000834F4D7|nr:putative sugar O-methyltransferase [Actinomadura macra]
MAQNFQASRQWERIQENWVTEEAALDLTNFKSDRRNYNISFWDPTANGVRYLKTLVFGLCADLDADSWLKIKRIQNRDLGDPLTVRSNGESVCLDYLQAVLEMNFIERSVPLAGAAVLEIGAGYGRTCHTLLSNHDLSRYRIIDLPNTLRLSQRYLGEVLTPEQYAKIEFVPVDDIGVMDPVVFDLCINIHSFTEMLPETVRSYLDLIDGSCRAFYAKNPLGKFSDRALDGHFKGDEAVRLAMETGPLRQVLDVFDGEDLEAAVPRYLAAYRPGESWECAGHERARPWSYFWQAVYKNARL